MTVLTSTSSRDPAPNVLKYDLKKPRICPIWGQSDTLSSQTYHPWIVINGIYLCIYCRPNFICSVTLSCLIYWVTYNSDINLHLLEPDCDSRDYINKHEFHHPYNHNISIKIHFVWKDVSLYKQRLPMNVEIQKTK